MTKAQIKPRNCASIWTDGQTIFAELPFGDLHHTISVPNTVEGLAKILQLISHRTETARIGELGDPTQHQIDKPLVYDRAKIRKVGKAKSNFTDDQRDNAKEVLRKMGII